MINPPKIPAHEFFKSTKDGEIWTDGRYWYAIRKNYGHYCGYCAIPEILSPGTIDKINVHGGVTLAEECNGEHIIGFDCSHWYDIENPKSIYFVRQQCKELSRQYEKLMGVD